MDMGAGQGDRVGDHPLQPRGDLQDGFQIVAGNRGQNDAEDPVAKAADRIALTHGDAQPLADLVMDVIHGLHAQPVPHGAEIIDRQQDAGR